jgi:hypothetical protein
MHTIYPETRTIGRRIKPHGYWKDKANQKEFFEQFARKWNIQKEEDWNKITTRMVVGEGGRFITYYNSSLVRGTVRIRIGN